MSVPERPAAVPRVITRRVAIEMAIVALGAVSNSAARALAAGVSTAAPRRLVFNPNQRAMISILAELIVPATDTPGAIQAGVPHFIETMVGDWCTGPERNLFFAGLAALDADCMRDHDVVFLSCSPKQQTQALGAAELKARAHPAASDVASDSNTPFFTTLRELTVLGYYTSELGATRELRYNPVPGHFDGDLPWTPQSRQWSS